jgi:hypothetical protein
MPNPALEMPDDVKQMVVDRSPELLRHAVLPTARLKYNADLGPVKTLEFTVSPWEGEPGNPEKCPIAVAMGRLLDVTEMHIAGERPWFKTRDGRKHELQFSADLALWVGRFDRNEPVLPFEMLVQYR